MWPLVRVGWPGQTLQQRMVLYFPYWNYFIILAQVVIKVLRCFVRVLSFMEEYVSTTTRKGRRTYMGLVLRMPQENSKIWSPTGKRKRGRPNEMLKRTFLRENVINLETIDKMTVCGSSGEMEVACDCFRLKRTSIDAAR